MQRLCDRARLDLREIRFATPCLDFAQQKPPLLARRPDGAVQAVGCM
jgi:hypothetical protein